MRDYALRRIWVNLGEPVREALRAMDGHRRGAPQPTLLSAVHQELLRKGLVEFAPARRISEKGLAVLAQVDLDDTAALAGRP